MSGYPLQTSLFFFFYTERLKHLPGSLYGEGGLSIEENSCTVIVWQVNLRDPSNPTNVSI